MRGCSKPGCSEGKCSAQTGLYTCTAGGGRGMLADCISTMECNLLCSVVFLSQAEGMISVRDGQGSTHTLHTTCLSSRSMPPVWAPALALSHIWHIWAFWHGQSSWLQVRRPFPACVKLHYTLLLVHKQGDHCAQTRDHFHPPHSAAEPAPAWPSRCS